jgi:hypothetical protein
MQTPKVSLLLCGLVLATTVAVRAEDTPAQAAARAAMLEEISKLNAQQPPPAAPPAEAAPVEKPAPAKPANDWTKVAPAEKPAETTPETEAIQAKKAEAKIVEVKPAQPVTPAVEQPMATKPVQPAAVQEAGDNPAQAAARAAMEQKMAEMQSGMMPPAVETKPAVSVSQTTSSSTRTVSVPTPAPAPVAAVPSQTKPAPATYNYPGKDLGLKPLVAPALPVNTTQQAQLQALLQQYKADQISPEEYFKQREAILGQH